MMSTHSDEERPGLLACADSLRVEVTGRLNPTHRVAMGQFLTPAATARLMASMFQDRARSLRLLDAGAGVGSLSAAFVSEICSREEKPSEVEVTAYEIEPEFIEYLKRTLERCQRECERLGIRMKWEVLQEDFIESSVAALAGGLFAPPRQEFTCAILNPPYRKIHSDSTVRRRLREIGVETGNLYTAFLAVVTQLLAPGGELVAISPRSFCNGPYFRDFRRAFLRQMTLRRIHVFESRQHAFRDDEVLQENVILYATQGRDKSKVVISSSTGPEDEHLVVHEADPEEVVRPSDPNAFIRIVPDELSQRVARLMESFTVSLATLGLDVSTGRVVDFRVRESLRARPAKHTVPLIYPANLSKGCVTWPAKTRKPQALAMGGKADHLLLPTGWYVLVKRFSAKEERRRVTAAVFDPRRVKGLQVGFENHLNYYHCGGQGVSRNLARGLAAFLNSRLVDLYFRQFSGHTQVNAADLRSLKYPSADALERLGTQIGRKWPGQSELDRLIEKELFDMPRSRKSREAVRTKEKVEEALVVLKALGFPRGQLNERSALVLLAVVGLEPVTPWSQATNPMIGVTPVMDFIAKRYGKKYAPNTRETVRRQTIHQFRDAGLVVANPDLPSRPVNSPKAVYQIEAGALELLQTFGTSEWGKSLREYLTSVETLRERYARAREMRLECSPFGLLTVGT